MKQQTNKIGENQLKILELFTRGFNKIYYVREIATILKIGPRTAQLNLEALEMAGILESITKGKIKNYSLRTNALTKEYLKLTEMHKYIRFLEKDRRIKEVILAIKSHMAGIGLVFGSYAKNREKNDSDLDVFVIGTYSRKEIEKLSELYALKITVKNYPLNLFIKEMHKDFLIKEILDNHIIFQGIEEFIERAWSIH